MILQSEAAFNPTDFIRTNGTSTTTAIVPFANGVLVEGDYALCFNRSDFSGQFMAMGIDTASQFSYWYSGQFSDGTGMPLEMSAGGGIGTNKNGGGFRFLGGGASGTGIGGNFTALGGTGTTGGTSGHGVLYGGDNIGSSGLAGKVYLAGGAALFGATPGWVAVTDVDAPTAPTHTLGRFSLFVDDHLEVDGSVWLDAQSANTMLYADANKLVSGVTVSSPLAFSAGTLSISASTTAFTEYIRKDGTTTTTAIIPFALGLSAAAQITSSVTTGTAPFSVASTTLVTNLNADLLDGKNTGTSGNVIPLMDGANTWSGANVWTSSSAFQETVSIADNKQLFIGDASAQLGNAYFVMDGINGWMTLDLSAIEVAANQVAFTIQGGGVQINPTGAIFSSSATLQIGPSVSGVAPTVNNILYIGKSITSGSSMQAAQIVFDYDVDSNSSGNFNVMNQITRYAGTGNLTSASIAGLSPGRNRFIVATGGTGTITLGSCMSTQLQLSSAVNAPITDFADYYQEAGTGGASVVTRAAGFFARDRAAPVGGSYTNTYGYRAEKLTRGTNNYAFASEGTGAGSGIYFNVPTSSTAATEYVRASAASTLQLAANTTQILDIGGTTQLTLTAALLTIKDTFDIALGTGTGTKWGTATTQKQAWWNAAPVVQDTGWAVSNVTTDRVFDANSTTVDELADVLGTLINQLKTYGLLGA